MMAQSAQALLTDLKQHLVHEMDIVREFLDILDEEAQALVFGVGEALAAATARKTMQADKLHAAAQTRVRCLTLLGFAHVQHDLAPVVQRYPDLRAAVDTLVDLVAQARAKNAENGVIIQTWQRQHQEMLANLQSLLARQENRLYDASGRSKSATSRSSSLPVALG